MDSTVGLDRLINRERVLIRETLAALCEAKRALALKGM